MDTVIQIYKQAGETPLDCIKKLKINRPELKLFPMTYAGRLDPLAEGVLLILVGDECLKKDEYLALPKEYEVEVLFGFATDTYDVMGKITKTKKVSDFSWSGTASVPLVRGPEKSNTFEVLKNLLPQFIGQIKQKYPAYSSRPVKGRPLFMWARENKLDQIEIPEHDVVIHSIDILNELMITSQELLEEIEEKIGQVAGDFRQAEILALWQENLQKDETYKIVKLKVNCGSGVYVRGLANDIGEKLGLPALALKIVRTKIRDFNIENCLP